jgi:hypothetical protein
MNHYIMRQNGIFDATKDNASITDQTVDDPGLGADELRMSAGIVRKDAKVSITEVKITTGVQKIHIGIIVTLNRTHIAPVAGERIGKNSFAALMKLGNHIMSKVMFRFPVSGIV